MGRCSEVAAALLNCTSEAGTVLLTAGRRVRFGWLTHLRRPGPCWCIRGFDADPHREGRPGALASVSTPGTGRCLEPPGNGTGCEKRSRGDGISTGSFPWRSVGGHRSTLVWSPKRVPEQWLREPGMEPRLSLGRSKRMARSFELFTDRESQARFARPGRGHTVRRSFSVASA